MFSLIITIISIALVAALALATLYYGGSAFNRGSAGAEAARLINEGQQVNGAVTIARADAAAGGTAVTTWGGLVSGNYLAQLPGGLGLDPAGTIGTATANVSAEVCEEVQKRATGSTTILADLAAGASQIYGCHEGAAPADPKVFFFKM